MTKHNAANERIKHEYFLYLAEAKGRDPATVDGVAKALARFEVSMGRRISSGSTSNKRSLSRQSWRWRLTPAPGSN